MCDAENYTILRHAAIQACAKIGKETSRTSFYGLPSTDKARSILSIVNLVLSSSFL